MTSLFAAPRHEPLTVDRDDAVEHQTYPGVAVEHNVADLVFGRDTHDCYVASLEVGLHPHPFQLYEGCDATLRDHGVTAEHESGHRDPPPFAVGRILDSTKRGPAQTHHVRPCRTCQGAGRVIVEARVALAR